MPDQVGGSFAPPLSDELLARYGKLAAGAEPRIRDAMQSLLKCCGHWWALPESGPDGSHAHSSGRGVVVPLDGPIEKELYDDIPWEDELVVFAKRFDEIDPLSQKELRDAAFHLLRHAQELNIGREPMTTDKL